MFKTIDTNYALKINPGLCVVSVDIIFLIG